MESQPNRSLTFGLAAALAAAQFAPAPLLIAPLAAAPAAAQQYGTRSVTISCYPRGTAPNSCTLPRGTQSVSFVGPDRTARCQEGRTWERRGNQLRVWGGCGGNFEALVADSGSGGGWGGGSGGSGGGWGGGSGGSGGSWGGSGGNQGFAAEVTCRSRDNRTEQCFADTGGRVVLLQQFSSAPCIEGQTWRFDRRSITVRNGCQARFGVGYGNWSGGNESGWGGGGQWGQGFAGQLECRSDNNRYRRCAAPTEGRVELLRQFSNAECIRGRSWGHDRNGIWVDRGCQARFGYGFGSVAGDTSGDDRGGGNAGAIIGGAALAAGLIALLANAGKGSGGSRTAASAGPASLTADLGKFPGDARIPGEACLKEAARQVGATGGTRVELVSVDRAERSGNGWMLIGTLAGTWPDHSQRMTMDCRATGSQVTAFDVR